MKKNTLNIKEYKMSLFIKGVKNIIPNRTIGLEEYIHLVKDDDRVLMLTQMYKTDDREGFKLEIKLKRLPLVTAQAVVTKRNKGSVKNRSGLFLIDIDKLDNVEEVWQKLISDPYITVCHKTISQKGFRGLLKIDVEAGEHSEYYLAVENYFKSTYGIEIDGACKDVVRLIAISHDPDVYVNYESIELNAEFLKIWKPEKSAVPINGNNVNASSINISDEARTYYRNKALNNARIKVERSIDGSKHKTLLNSATLLGSYVKYGIVEYKKAVKTLKEVIDSREDVKDVKGAYKTIEDGLGYGVEHPKPITELVVTTDQKFWKCNYDAKGNSKLQINKTLVYRLIGRNGFGQFLKGNTSNLIHVEDNIIKLVEKFDLIQFIMNHVSSLPWDIGDDKTRDDLEEKTRSSLNTLFSESQLCTAIAIEPTFKKDDKNTANFYFRNGIVEVTKDNIDILPYDALEDCIWDTQILDAEFDERSIEWEELIVKSEFAQFLFNIANQDDERFVSICTIFGYLLHSYKDPSFSRAVILCDEQVSENPMGGTGKGIALKALSKIKKSIIIDGKSFSFSSQFLFQQVQLDTDLVVFEDTEKKFNFEKLFPSITEGLNVEKKNKDKFHISYQDSPKLLITTNYSILGDGNSNERRRITYEFSQHYNASNTPLEEFGHSLFEDWDVKQWDYFYQFMINCVQMFLCKGVSMPKEINVSTRKLIVLTSKEFVEWADKTIVLNKEYEKPILKKVFSETYREYKEFNWFNQHKFNKWLKDYGRIKKYEAVERLSMNKQLIKFSQLEK